MAIIFRGQFMAKMDVKSRLAVPAGLRSSVPSSKDLVITKSIYQQKKCLDVYSFESWQELENRIARLPSLNANIQAFQRFYLSAGQVVEMDKQNRILVPKNLKEYADLSPEVVVIGMGEKFEIWNAEQWQSISEDLANNFEAIQAAVAKLESGD